MEETPRETISLDDDGLFEGLRDILLAALATPELVYASVFPPNTQAPVSDKRNVARAPDGEENSSRRGDSEEENEEGRNARFRAGALGSLSSILSQSIA